MIWFIPPQAFFFFWEEFILKLIMSQFLVTILKHWLFTCLRACNSGKTQQHPSEVCHKLIQELAACGALQFLLIKCFTRTSIWMPSSFSCSHQGSPQRIIIIRMFEINTYRKQDWKTVLPIQYIWLRPVINRSDVAEVEERCWRFYFWVFPMFPEA